ncbi:hypothetical protein TIFTF001_016734 [Ficus carica]|uniref:Uncharacterized protein n=1 Tax=Ficus carica TaxID=3494 RepID=A0AA88DA37_FICCA|nr:hypothetical protein TIFTF001_016734 [Ficus carica]
MAAHNVNPPSPEQMLSPVYSNKCSDWAQASRAEYQEYLNTLRQMRREICAGAQVWVQGGAAVQMQCQAEDQRLLSGKMVRRNLTKTSRAPPAELARQKTLELSDGVQVAATDPLQWFRGVW